ncbi:MAG: alpha/beta hydrolase [Mycobacteriaceae bacterium]
MAALEPSSVHVPGPWTHRDVHANGIRFHVVEADGGAPGAPLVLLLHGFPEFWWSWRHQLVALAESGARVVAVDLRGYGDTDKPPRGYDGWTLAGDVAGLVRALGAPRAVLVGHDWGGLIAWAAAALHPRLVSGLGVLGAPHPVALRRAVRRHPLTQGRASSYAVGFQLPWRPERVLVSQDGAAIEDILRRWSGPAWPDTDDFVEVCTRNRSAMLIPGVVHSAMEYYRWALRSQVRSEGRRFAADLAAPVAVPVLALHGALDVCLLPATARASAGWAPAGELRVLEGVGHFPHQEAPDITNAALAELLGRV